MKLIITLITVIFCVVGYFVALLGFPSNYAWVSNMFIVIMALPSFYGLIQFQGFKRGLIIIISLMVFALLFEGQAIYTGIPYSEFLYSDKIAGKILGIVPWTIGFAWAPLFIGCAVIASKFSKLKQIKFTLLTAVFLVLVDLVLDPGATKAGLWIWQSPSGFYGVPLMNFFGWFVSGILGAIIYQFLINQSVTISKTNSSLLSISLVLSLAFWTGVSVYFNMLGVTILGVALLGAIFLTEN